MGQSSWRQANRSQISLRELEARARRNTDQAKYDLDVEGILDDALSEFNNRDVEGIDKHLETIEDALSNEIEGTVQMTLGGSVRKHTYANGISDVDMLVYLNDTSLADKSPDEVMQLFERQFVLDPKSWTQKWGFKLHNTLAAKAFWESQWLSNSIGVR